MKNPKKPILYFFKIALFAVAIAAISLGAFCPAVQASSNDTSVADTNTDNTDENTESDYQTAEAGGYVYSFHTETINGTTYATDVFLADTITTDITVPEKIGGYPVYSLGEKDAESKGFLGKAKMKYIPRIDLSACTSLYQLNANCFAKQTFVVVVVVPRSLRVVEENAFKNCNDMIVKSYSLNIEFQGEDTTEEDFYWVSAKECSAADFFGDKCRESAEVLTTTETYEGSGSVKFTLKLPTDENGALLGTQQSGILGDHVFLFTDYEKMGEEYYADSSVKVPVRKHYDFVGYFTENGTPVFDKNGDFIRGSIPTTEAVTLYGRWTPTYHTVTFESGRAGATAVSPVPALYGSTLSLTAYTVSAPGYVFKGWTGSPFSAPGTGLEADSALSGLETADTAEVMDDMTLYAVWEDAEYTIRCHGQGGVFETGETIYEKTQKYTEAISLSKIVCTRPGYTLAGWSLTENGKILLSDADSRLATEGIVDVYAVWTENTYSVVFKENTGEETRKDVLYETEFTMPGCDSAPLGTKFSAWTDSKTGNRYPAGETVKSLAESGDIILTADYEPVVCTITYHANASDATGSVPVQYAEYGKTASLAEGGFQRTGKTFLGWTTSPVSDFGADDSADSLKEDANYLKAGADFENTDGTKDSVLNLYAVWQTVRYTITYTDGGETLKKTPSSYVYGKAVSLPVLEKTGYVFAGWVITDTGKTISSVAATRSGNLNLAASWKKASYSIRTDLDEGIETVLFDGNNVTSADFETLLQNVSVSAKDGYFVTSLTVTDDATGKVLLSQDASDRNLSQICSEEGFTMPASGITVSARSQAKYCRVFFDADGGLVNGKETAEEFYSYGQEYKIRFSAEKGGCDFLGWSTGADEKDIISVIPSGSGSDTTLTAVWQPKTYPITLDANGGTIDGESSTVLHYTYGDETFRLPVPEKNGCVFAGWKNYSTGETETSFDAKNRYGSAVYYAVWVSVNSPDAADLILTEPTVDTSPVAIAQSEDILKEPDNFYYNGLTMIQKRLYTSLYQIYSTSTSGEPNADDREIYSTDAFTFADLIDAGTALTLEHPELFWIRYFSASSVKEKDGVYRTTVRPQLAYLKEIYVWDYTHYEENFQKVVQNLGLSDTDDTYTKLKTIYQYIAENYSYRSTTYIEGATSNDELRSVGYMLSHKQGVCESYANLTKVLCDYYKIPCEIAVSDDHMWNEVLVDGSWYLFDVTWGDQKTYVSWKYFLKGSNMDMTGHVIVNYYYSRTDADGNKVPVTEFGCFDPPVLAEEDYVYPETEKTSASSDTGSISLNQEIKNADADTSSVPSKIQTTSVSGQKTQKKNKITLNKTKLTLKKGKTFKLVLKNASGVKWKSSNKKTVKVSGGRIKALKKGKATVTAIYKRKKYVCRVVVKGR